MGFEKKKKKIIKIEVIYLLKLRYVVRRMGRAMLRISLQGRKRNSLIRERTGIEDIEQRIWNLNYSWVGHVMRREDGRWSRMLT